MSVGTNDRIVDLDRTVAHLSKLVMTLFDSQKEKADGSDSSPKTDIKDGNIQDNEASVNKPEKANKSKEPKRQSKKNRRHRVTWIGTSLSKALDRSKFENDLDV